MTIIHFALMQEKRKMKYLCNWAVACKLEKLTTEITKVTCSNCLQKLGMIK